MFVHSWSLKCPTAAVVAHQLALQETLAPGADLLGSGPDTSQVDVGERG